MTKKRRRPRPRWTVSDWASDADTRGEMVLTAIVVLLAAVMLWETLGR